MSAPAQPPPEVPRSPLEVAREHMERGQALYGAGRYIESAEEFLRAYEAQPFAAFLYNAGVAYEKLDDPGRAAEFFARFLEADPGYRRAGELNARVERLRGLAHALEQERAAEALAQGANAQDAARAQVELDAAKKRMAELEAQIAALGGKATFKSLLSVKTTPPEATVTVKNDRGDVVYRGTGATPAETLDEGQYVVQVEHPKYQTISTPIAIAPGKVYVIIVEMSQGQFLGFLRVQSDVPGASVYVDEREAGAMGQTPFQNAVRVGKHRLWVERPGYKPIEREVEVAIGEDTLLKAALERVEHGRIRVVASRPDAEVYVDGKPVGRVPVERDASSGRHQVRVRADGMKDWEETVQVERGQATPVRVRLRPKVGRAGAWVTAGVAAGMLGASIGVAVAGENLKKELDRDQAAGVTRSDDARVDRGKWLWIGADIGFGLSAALAGLSVFYFVRDPLPDSEGRVLKPRDWTFAPYFAPDRAGGHVHVRF